MNKSKPLAIRLHNDVLASLINAKKTSGMTASEIIDAALDKFFHEHPTPNTQADAVNERRLARLSQTLAA